jgi:hypothetical protein
MDLTSSPVRCHSGLRQSELTPRASQLSGLRVMLSRHPCNMHSAAAEIRTRSRSATARMPRSVSTGPKLPSRKPVTEQAQVLEGPSMQLADAEVLCAFARFCDPNGQVWNEVKDTNDPKVRVQFLKQVGYCPSGRLIAVDKHDGESIEPKLPPSIALVEDPAQKCSGPLWVRGGVALVGADGQAYEIRNRMTLCRCGKSENKPFCKRSACSRPQVSR